MVSILRGDLLNADVPIICHQVNCSGVMGAGIARQIRDKWPHVYDSYKTACDNASKRRDLLGKVQHVRGKEGAPDVINIFGQYGYGSDGGVYTDYTALIHAFQTINCRFRGRTIGFPYGFGCGLAGGDWFDVEQLIVKYLPDCDVKIYIKG